MSMEDFEEKDNRARGKGSRGPYSKTIPDTPIPDVIKLPDGREFLTKNLVNKIKNRMSYSLLNKTLIPPKQPRVGSTHCRLKKYSEEDRKWQAEAEVIEIMKAYNMSERTATATRSAARRILGLPSLHLTKVKYTQQDIEYILANDARTIAEKYGLVYETARNIKNKFKKIQESNTDNCIIDHTKSK